MISPLKLCTSFNIWYFEILDKIKSLFHNRKNEIIEDPYIVGLFAVKHTKEDTKDTDNTNSTEEDSKK